MNALSVAALVTVACGYTPLVDSAGRTIDHPLRAGVFEGGVVVVDSTTAGLRAVIGLEVELDAESLPIGPAAYRWAPPTLRLGSAREIAAARFVGDPPSCAPPGPRAWNVPQPSGSGLERQQVETRTCAMTIRAEYAVGRSVLRTDSLAVLYGGRIFPVRWRGR